MNTKLDTATLVFSGRKGRADIFWEKAAPMGLFSPSKWEKIFDTMDRAKKVVFCDYVTWNAGTFYGNYPFRTSKQQLTPFFYID